MWRAKASAAHLIAASFLLPASASAQSAIEKFYKGKTVTIVIGASMGGSYGLYSQLVGRHLGRQIPGKPTFIVQSMPAAGGIASLNYVYNVAPKDGSAMIFVAATAVLETVLNDKAKFDATKFQYVGRLVSTDFIGVVAKRTGVKSLEDMKSKPVVFGGAGVRNGLAISAHLVNMAAGTKIKLITGYRGIGPIFLAIEKGELDGISSTVVSPKYLEFMEKFRRGEPTDVIPVFAASFDKIPGHENLPTFADMKPDERLARFMRLFASEGMLGRSLAFPPGAPKEFVEAFRTGFQNMLKDPVFLAEIKKANIPLEPLSGAEIQRKVAEASASTPKDKIADVRKVYEEVMAGIIASSKMK